MLNMRQSSAAVLSASQMDQPQIDQTIPFFATKSSPEVSLKNTFIMCYFELKRVPRWTR